MPGLPTIRTIAEVAEYLRCSPEAVIAELTSGHLKGFRIGNEWRTTVDHVAEFVGQTRADTVRQDVAWQTIDSFRHAWPRRAGENPPHATENHDPAYRGVFPVNGRDIPMLIGFTDRDAAGMVRKHVNVFKLSGLSKRPLVEFNGANDYETSGLLASIIKSRDGRHVRPGDTIPEEYRDFPLCVYSELVVGPNAANSMAVVAHRDNLTLMARHALIRAAWKGII